MTLGVRDQWIVTTYSTWLQPHCVLMTYFAAFCFCFFVLKLKRVAELGNKKYSADASIVYTPFTRDNYSFQIKTDLIRGLL